MEEVEAEPSPELSDSSPEAMSSAPSSASTIVVCGLSDRKQILHFSSMSPFAGMRSPHTTKTL